MVQTADIVDHFPWHDLSQETAWLAWREAKNRAFEKLQTTPLVELDSFDSVDPQALHEIKHRCSTANFAIYRVKHQPETVEKTGDALVRFASKLGLELSEDHRSAEDNGIVVLRTSSEPGKEGYIPYTSKPLNWHTDGYYNPSGRPVMSFILHCYEQAATGGENQLVDPEMAYLAMRDANPDFVRAMMRPDAMTIPENREQDGTIRPASVGPVFFPHPASGRLQMRYTARTRSIAWRDDGITQEAADWLRLWLSSDAATTHNVRFQPGDGVVNNNVLHNRTGFEAVSARAVLRVRFHERITEA
ncbi:MAG TPA: TauD/TfdA family dioxygenase [Paracoccaceae bacterium]|nr:TauD/TfdA family dioxygenase [Paracoccaceae bacterium]